MEVNEKQLKMLRTAIISHTSHLNGSIAFARDKAEKDMLSLELAEFEKLQSDIELLLLRY